MSHRICVIRFNIECESKLSKAVVTMTAHALLQQLSQHSASGQWSCPVVSRKQEILYTCGPWLVTFGYNTQRKTHSVILRNTLMVVCWNLQNFGVCSAPVWLFHFVARVLTFGVCMWYRCFSYLISRALMDSFISGITLMTTVHSTQFNLFPVLLDRRKWHILTLCCQYTCCTVSVYYKGHCQTHFWSQLWQTRREMHHKNKATKSKPNLSLNNQ